MGAKTLFDPIHILSIVPNPVVCLNERLVITYVNPRGPEVFDYTLDELYGKSINQLIPRHKQQDVMRHLNHVIDAPDLFENLTAPSVKIESEMVRRDGRTFNAELSIGCIKKCDKTLIILFIHDLTQYIKRQEAHQEIDASFKAVVQASPLAIYSLDRQGHVWMWNPAAERIFGWEKDEVIGRPTPTVPAEEHAKYEKLLQKSLRGEPIKGEEVKRRRKDGQLIDVNVFTAPLTNLTGDIVGLMAVLEDITERKSAERRMQMLNRQLADLNQTLERRVQERTAEAEQRAKELARSNAELEQFAYVASHDLQEPLRMVASYTKLIARRYHGRLDADADEFIDYAVNGATRMQQLINDLLAYSRLGTRGKPFSAVSCQSIIDRVLQFLEPAITETNARIHVGPMPTLTGDASQLLQLFQNMIANGLKFRRDVPPKLSVSAENRGNEWLFTVRDNGIGIESTYGSQIFEIFQRLHTRAEYPGTGIGLAICKKIVERHGGRIWLETSKPGMGSVFCFTISTNKEILTGDPANSRTTSNQNFISRR